MAGKQFLQSLARDAERGDLVGQRLGIVGLLQAAQRGDHLVPPGKLGATGGNAFGVILVNGLARAVWKPKFSGSKMQVELDAFEKFPDKTMDKVKEEFQKIALFLSAKDLQLK